MVCSTAITVIARLTPIILEQPERICVLVPEELSDNHICVASDKVEIPPIGLVLQPMVPTRRVVTLELSRRGMSKQNHLEQKREKTNVITSGSTV